MDGITYYSMDELIEAIVSEGIVSGYCNYWIEAVDSSNAKDKEFSTVDERLIYAVRNGGLYIQPIDDEKSLLTAEDIVESFAEYEAFLPDEIGMVDAEVADTVIQIVLFGGVIYA